MRRLLAVAALALATAQGAAGSADHAAYVIAGKPWPGHVIRVYVTFADQRAAIRQAIDAWNASGANVRFELASRSRAQVVVLPVPLNHPLADAGFGTIGHVDPHSEVNDPFPKIKLGANGIPLGLDGEPKTYHGAHVWLRHRNDRFGVQRHYTVEDWAQVAAHELGHVLGLGHPKGVCSTMLPHGFAAPPCQKIKFWQRYCGTVLMPDDVAGAIRLYGGHTRPLPALRGCDLTTAPPPPANVNAVQAAGYYTITWSPPADKKILGVAVRAAQGTCPSSPGDTTKLEAKASTGRYDWTPPGPGEWCVAVWFVRGNDQPSMGPATLHITVSMP